MLACLLLIVDIQSLYYIIYNFLVEVLKILTENSVTICIVHPIPQRWLRDRTDKATMTKAVCPIPSAHVIPASHKPGLELLQFRESHAQAKETSVLPYTKTAHLNCSGPASPDSPQPPHPKSGLEPWPCAAPSISHPMTHKSGLADASSHLPKSDLLFDRADESPEQLNHPFPALAAVIVPAPTLSLPRCLTTLACVELVSSFWNQLRLHCLGKALGERVWAELMGRGFTCRIRSPPQKSTEGQTSPWAQMLLQAC